MMLLDIALPDQAWYDKVSGGIKEIGWVILNFVERKDLSPE